MESVWFYLCAANLSLSYWYSASSRSAKFLWTENVRFNLRLIKSSCVPFAALQEWGLNIHDLGDTRSPPADQTVLLWLPPPPLPPSVCLWRSQQRSHGGFRTRTSCRLDQNQVWDVCCREETLPRQHKSPVCFHYGGGEWSVKKTKLFLNSVNQKESNNNNNILVHLKTLIYVWVNLYSFISYIFYTFLHINWRHVFCFAALTRGRHV